MTREPLFHELFWCDVSALKLDLQQGSAKVENFESALRSKLQQLMQFPESAPEWKDGIRTALVGRRYPYVVVYEIDDATVKFTGLYPAVRSRAT